MKNYNRSVLSVTLATALLSLTACGGGDSSSSSRVKVPTAKTPTKKTVSKTPTPTPTKKTTSKAPTPAPAEAPATPKTSTPTTTGSNSSGNKIGTASLTPTGLLARINKIRSQGRYCYTGGKKWYPAVPAVKWNTQLESASKKFANDMAQHNYYNYFGSNAHIQPDTSKPKVNGKYTDTITLNQRIQDSEYLIQSKRGGYAGENLAWSVNTINPDVDTALNKAYQDWLSSTHRHCETMMQADWQDFAMSGAYNKTTQKYYFVQLFGKQD